MISKLNKKQLGSQEICVTLSLGITLLKSASSTLRLEDKSILIFIKLVLDMTSGQSLLDSVTSQSVNMAMISALKGGYKD